MNVSKTQIGPTIDLSVDLGNLHLKNPVTTASGTFGYGIEFKDYLDLNRLGGVFVKGLTLKPRPGHPQPRIAETSSGMLNCIGLQNVGVEEFVKVKMPLLRQYDVSVIANINGSSLQEYFELTEILTDTPGIAAIEVNISCPNVKEGGIAFGSDPGMTEKVTLGVKKRTSLPVIIKLTPNVTDIRVIARSAYQAGADILSMINTLLGLAVDAKSRKPLLSNITGGLSGPAIKPVALRCIHEVHQAVPIPIIGMGGIMTGIDVIEFMIVGASAISLGTANFLDPCRAASIVDEIETYCLANGISRISDKMTGVFAFK